MLSTLEKPKIHGKYKDFEAEMNDFDAIDENMTESEV